MFTLMGRNIEQRKDDGWVREGNFDVEIPKEIKANCDYFVKYRKGENCLCLFKRKDAKNSDQFEYKISYTYMTQLDVNSAIQQTAYDDVKKKHKVVAINPHHSDGAGSPVDGIETCFVKNLETLEVALTFINSINKLAEIEGEVYSSLGIKRCDETIKHGM